MVAKAAQDCGVKRVWIDLESLGKEERQKGMNTVKSQHTLQDISVLRDVLDSSELLVRVNPINPGSKAEIEEAIDRGADMLMLPMFKSVEEVKSFIDFVGGRAKTTLLFETKESFEHQDEILTLGGFDEAHIGLNDMHLSYHLTFMFELLSNGLVETMCKRFKDYGIPYGFGGIAKIGEGLLLVRQYIQTSPNYLILNSITPNRYAFRSTIAA